MATVPDVQTLDELALLVLRGHAEQAVATLDDLLADHPDDEDPPWSELHDARAHLAAGNATEALQMVERARAALSD